MADSVYLQLSRYTQPVVIIFGTIGSLLNVALFTSRKVLRQTSCSLYFRALSINDLLVLYSFVLTQWLADQFGLDPLTEYEWYCRTMKYVTTSLCTISPYLVVLACVDRLCTSSTNSRLRRVATKRIASFLIPLAIIVIFASYIHIPIKFRLFSTSSTSICNGSDADYIRILSVFLLIYFCFMPPLLMVILCIATFILLRRQRNRIMPVNQARLRRRDSQFMKMLFIYVTLNMICIVPLSIVFVIAVYQLPNVSPIAASLFRIFVLLLNVNYSMSFYAYTLSTPFYRIELWNWIKSTREQLRRRTFDFITITRQPLRRATTTQL